jgi:hypothetical protein
MDSQRFAIKGRVIGADDAQLQDALATSRHARAAALPVRAGRRGDVRGADSSWSSACRTAAAPSGLPSYEPEVQQSGLGELVGEAVLESEPGRVELRVDFPGHGCSGAAYRAANPRRWRRSACRGGR